MGFLLGFEAWWMWVDQWVNDVLNILKMAFAGLF